MNLDDIKKEAIARLRSMADDLELGVAEIRSVQRDCGAMRHLARVEISLVARSLAADLQWYECWSEADQ